MPGKSEPEREKGTYNHEGIRTLNLLIRSQTPYPLGHVVLQASSCEKFYKC